MYEIKTGCSVGARTLEPLGDDGVQGPKPSQALSLCPETPDLSASPANAVSGARTPPHQYYEYISRLAVPEAANWQML